MGNHIIFELMSVLPLLYQLKKGKIIYIYISLQSFKIWFALSHSIVWPKSAALSSPLFTVGYWPLASRFEDVFLILSRKYSSSLAY